MGQCFNNERSTVRPPLPFCSLCKFLGEERFSPFGEEGLKDTGCKTALLFLPNDVRVLVHYYNCVYKVSTAELNISSNPEFFVRN